MDPEMFLELARTLSSTKGRPEFYRTAISRAYYAAFHVGSQVITSLGIQLSTGPGGHGELRNCLGASGDSHCRKISSRLQTLHARRIAADYHLDDSKVEAPEEAGTACLEAAEIMSFLKTFRDDSGKQEARLEMKRVARETLRLTVT